MFKREIIKSLAEMIFHLEKVIVVHAAEVAVHPNYNLEKVKDYSLAREKLFEVAKLQDISRHEVSVALIELRLKDEV